MAPLRPQKMAKAASAVQIRGVSSCWEKMTPAKTKRFLTHWRGGSETRRARDRRTRAPLQPDHMRLGAQGAGQVAGVDDEAGPPAQAGPPRPPVGPPDPPPGREPA